VRLFRRNTTKPIALPDPQCTALTRNGNRCRLPVIPGTATCRVHKPADGKG
jgi:hypothetical protein